METSRSATRRTTSYGVDIPLDADAPRAARRLVRRLVGSHPGIEDAVLAASEIVTNAVRHRPPSVPLARLGVETSDGCLKVSVRHEGPTFRRSDRARPSSATGRGLGIVDEVADRWGVDTDHGEIEVWFEIDR